MQPTAASSRPADPKAANPTVPLHPHCPSPNVPDNLGLGGRRLQQKVLLIEDEPHIVEALSFLLSREGLDVSAHSNGADAARVARDAAPDLVILDVMLPNKSGFDILRELRASPSTATMPVMMLTAKGQGKDRAEAEEAGANLFMTKPFSNADIVAGVKQLLG